MRDDERVLSVLVEADGRHGPLLLFEDPDEPGVTLVPRVNRSVPWITERYAVRDEILYETGPGGRPHGLFRARLAP